MAVPLTDDEYRLFREWLSQEYGLRFGPERREILRARLEPRRAALNMESFESLLYHLRFHPDREDERRRVLSHLTNNESYFFRETGQLDILGERLLPELASSAARDGRELSLLSAGSASGEEAYTLVLVARKAVPGVPVRVTGVDVDVEALERARRGTYRPHAFRAIGEAVRDRWFDPDTDTGEWRIRDPIRSAARFQQGNLVDPGWSESVPRQDAVFCRNVLIYFDEDGIRRAVDNLYRVVRPGGYLFLGHAESLSRVPTRFVPVREPGAIFYRRPEA